MRSYLEAPESSKSRAFVTLGFGNWNVFPEKKQELGTATWELPRLFLFSIFLGIQGCLVFLGDGYLVEFCTWFKRGVLTNLHLWLCFWVAK